MTHPVALSEGPHQVLRLRSQIPQRDQQWRLVHLPKYAARDQLLRRLLQNFTEPLDFLHLLLDFNNHRPSLPGCVPGVPTDMSPCHSPWSHGWETHGSRTIEPSASLSISLFHMETSRQVRHLVVLRASSSWHAQEIRLGDLRFFFPTGWDIPIAQDQQDQGHVDCEFISFRDIAFCQQFASVC